MKKSREKRERRERERGKRERERDLHFCLHLAGIVDGVTSLGGSVGLMVRSTPYWKSVYPGNDTSKTAIANNFKNGYH